MSSSSPKPRISGIYRITNTVTGDFYIGSSKNVRQRWLGHRHGLTRGTHANARLQHAWNKYGEDSFAFEMLVEVDPECLLDMEQSFFDQHRPAYNISPIAGAPVGMRGRKFTEEHRRKIGDGNRGKKRSPELREAIRQSRLGSKKSAAAIEKHRRAVQGATRSDETRDKIRQSLMGRKRPREVYEKQQQTRRANLAARIEEAARTGVPYIKPVRKGRKLTAEHAAKLVQARLGQPLSVEHREKIRQSLKGRTRSVEAIEKQRQTLREKRLMKVSA